MFHYLTYIVLSLLLCDSPVTSNNINKQPQSKRSIATTPFRSPNYRGADYKILPLIRKDAAGPGKPLDRHERGIVIIDDDFDVPPDPGVKQGWGENEYETAEELFRTEKIFTEGSGTAFYSESTASPEPVTIMKNERTQVEKKTQPKKSVAPTTEIEGSGGDIPSYSSANPEEVGGDTSVLQDLIPKDCLNETCATEEIVLQQGYPTIVPEGTNLTLSCIIPNRSDDEMLYWYKTNGSIYSLQAFDSNHELNFSVFDTKTVHSGVYVCVKRIIAKSCCHRELHITVYAVPAYNYQLLIVGFITATCLLTCIFLTVWRTVALKRYTKQFVKENNNEKPLLI